MNSVSVIVPCYNEERSIGLLLGALNRQNYPKELIEILIIDGMSSDNTIKIVNELKSQLSELKIRIVENPKRNIPSAVNIGIEASTNKIIVRMDAHSIPDPDYIKFCVEDLDKNIAANVGGRWMIIPGSDSKISRCIAQAASHPFGVGDAKYRYSNEPGFVDTVPFGAFYRSLFDEIGFYNENLLTNEDYEFNARIRETGKKIYFDPRIKTEYIARKNLKELSGQYWRYGFWKVQMLKKYPKTIKLRQAIPPLFVLGLISLIIISIFIPIIWNLIGLILLLYVVVLVGGTIISNRENLDISCLVCVPLSIMTMHFVWGSGFIFGFFKGSSI